METLQHVFPLNHASPSPAPPTPAQGPLSPPTLDTPQMPYSSASSRSGEPHVAVHIPDTPEIVLISSDDELMKDPKDDPEEDLELEEQ